jgi:uncharacterized membrane protein
MSMPHDTAGAALAPIASLDARAPWRWLREGWCDFRASRGTGALYGACFAVMGWLIVWVFRHSPEYTLSLISGFLLVGPFLCMGLYDISRRLERGERSDFGQSLLCWQPCFGSLALMVGVLIILELLWGRASLVVFALFFSTGMPRTASVVEAVFNPDNLEFIVAFLAVGGVFAALVFAVSVVAFPMVLDRGTDAVTAGLTSIRACLANPGVMLLWGAIITAAVLLAMLPWFLGLLVVGPVLGHASWHAYRDIVQRND